MRTIHVVAGVLRDRRARVLLAQRPPGKPHAGLWEFPGGKVEPGETAHQALARELDEELGIEVDAARPLIAIPSGRIVLDVWDVPAWSGRLHAREGQALAWVELAAIDAANMPPADRPVLAALRLPSEYLITPTIDGVDAQTYLAALERALAAGVRLVQLRACDPSRERIAALARAARAICVRHGALLVLNGDWQLAEVLGLDGAHLPAAVAAKLAQRPLPAHRWLGVSCHDADELAHAARIGADFATLSPVLATASHPTARPLGWTQMRALIENAALPVYALGGLEPADVATARMHGAQGIAAIRGLWKS